MLKDALDKLLDNCDSKKESALAVDYLKQSVSVAREIGDRTSEVCKLCCLGNAYWFSGDYAKASESWQQSVKTAQQIGNRYQAGEVRFEQAGYGLLSLGRIYQGNIAC